MRTCSAQWVSSRSQRTKDPTHDTEGDLTTDEKHVDTLTSNRDGDSKTGHDTDQASHQSSLPRSRVPFDEALADDLTTEGDGQGSRLSCHQQSDGEERGEG